MTTNNNTTAFAVVQMDTAGFAAYGFGRTANEAKQQALENGWSGVQSNGAVLCELTETAYALVLDGKWGHGSLYYVYDENGSPIWMTDKDNAL